MKKATTVTIGIIAAVALITVGALIVQNLNASEFCEVERGYVCAAKKPVTCVCPEGYEWKVVKIGWGPCTASGKGDCPAVTKKCVKKHAWENASSVSGTGVVRYISFEGGFYGIISDDSKQYNPINLPKEFKKDGLRVSFKGEKADVVGIRTWGTTIKITDIKKEESEGDSNGSGEVSFNLIKVVDVDKPDGYRPEIAATKDRVFVVYAYNPPRSGRDIRVKIFNKEMDKEIVTKTIVSHGNNGGPTDIRIASDSNYLYAFYEVGNRQSKTSSLYGAKYSLNDDFERVAYTGAIATGRAYNVQQAGDERKDDPEVFLDDKYVYVITMYRGSFSKSGKTKYHVRRFDRNLNLISEFDLDLSQIADGAAGQPSAIYENGYYYMVFRTTTGEYPATAIDWQCPSDLIMAKMDSNWKVVDSKIIASDKNSKGEEYIEGYVTGIDSDDEYFYIAYNRKDSSGMASVIKIFDKNWRPVLTHEYKHTTMKRGRPDGFRFDANREGGMQTYLRRIRRGVGEIKRRSIFRERGGRVRPSIYTQKNRVYAGNNGAEVYIFLFNSKHAS